MTKKSEESRTPNHQTTGERLQSPSSVPEVLRGRPACKGVRASPAQSSVDGTFSASSPCLNCKRIAKGHGQLDSVDQQAPWLVPEICLASRFVSLEHFERV